MYNCVVNKVQIWSDKKNKCSHFNIFGIVQPPRSSCLRNICPISSSHIPNFPISTISSRWKRILQHLDSNDRMKSTVIKSQCTNSAIGFGIFRLPTEQPITVSYRFCILAKCSTISWILGWRKKNQREC